MRWVIAGIVLTLIVVALVPFLIKTGKWIFEYYKNTIK